MDLSPLLPDFQLQFGQSCTLPFIQASKYGLKMCLLLLTDYVSGSIVQYKAAVLKISKVLFNHWNSDIDSLSFVTYFNASYCHFNAGHLEQLALACPNLKELNITNNPNCLKNLQGLHVIATCCQNLQGLNLLMMSVKNVKIQVKLWKILTEMKFSYLAIDLCAALLPHGIDEETTGTIVDSYRKCSNLKALDVRTMH